MLLVDTGKPQLAEAEVFWLSNIRVNPREEDKRSERRQLAL